jgi:hypothetical protein
MERQKDDKVGKVLGLLQDEQGFVGSELQGSILLLPAEVKTEGGWLIYRTAGFLRFSPSAKRGETEEPRPKRKVRGALDGFVRLAFPSQAERQSSSDIEEFATRWGGLGLCHHGLPHTHPPVGNPFADPGAFLTRCAPTVSKVGMYTEQIKLWRDFAARAFVALRLAATLRRSPNPGTDKAHRQILVQTANKWLSNGSVTVRLVDRARDRRWPEGVEFRLSVGAGLYGVLAAQLAMALTLSRQFYVCAECGRLFTPDPSHRPRTGRRAFCLQCGRPAAVRHAMRDMRQRPPHQTGAQELICCC